MSEIQEPAPKVPLGRHSGAWWRKRAREREAREAAIAAEGGTPLVTVLPRQKVKGANLDSVFRVRCELANVYADMRNGRILCEDGSRLAFTLVKLIEVMQTEQLDARLTALEAAPAGQGRMTYAERLAAEEAEDAPLLVLPDPNSLTTQ
jgi:hypothetical protein